MFDLLDILSDEEVLKFLDLKFGYDEPVWEECSKEEYEEGQTEQMKHLDSTFYGTDVHLPSYEEIEDWFVNKQFKKEPIWKKWKGGILTLIKIQDEQPEPDYYRYYKKVGTKRIIMVGSQIVEYLNKRGIQYEK